MRTVTVICALLPALFATAGAAGEVWITPTLRSVQALNDGKPVTVERNQDRKHRIEEYYTYTSRKCPPFCVQPMVVAPGVETVGELDVLAYLSRMADGDSSVLLVDTRTPKWPRRSMIPGAINVPWTELTTEYNQDPALAEILEQQFGARVREGSWGFANAKTLVLYCNGFWCAQSSNAVHALLRVHYPPEKLKWYRGGMQAWVSVGLSTVRLAQGERD
jgi:rhodanese-related sulfurtransferase